MAHDLDAYFKAVEHIARKAGEMVRDTFYKDKLVDMKTSNADLVTETDKNVEELIISYLHTTFPSHSFIGEESAIVGRRCELTDNPTWIIDPIDGTTNFVHRLRHIAISIGLLIDKQTVIGLIYNPILEEMYTARIGEGAFCNGKRLQATKTTDISQALVCTEFGSSRVPSHLDSKIRSMRNVVEKSHGLRCLGSAAIHMCLCAAGAADAHFSYGLHIWDIAAGRLIVTEAGGVVMDTSGEPLDLMARRVLCAGTEALARQIVPLLEPLELERD